jgi:hypothetical protein
MVVEMERGGVVDFVALPVLRRAARSLAISRRRLEQRMKQFTLDALRVAALFID